MSNHPLSEPSLITRGLSEIEPAMRETGACAPIDSVLNTLLKLHTCITGIRDGSIDREGIVALLDSAYSGLGELLQFRSVTLQRIRSCLQPISQQWTRELDRDDEQKIIGATSRTLGTLFNDFDNDTTMDPQTLLPQLEAAYEALHELAMCFRAEIVPPPVINGTAQIEYS